MEGLRAFAYFSAGLGTGVLLMRLYDLALMARRYKQVSREVERYRREMLTTYKEGRHGTR